MEAASGITKEKTWPRDMKERMCSWFKCGRFFRQENYACIKIKSKTSDSIESLSVCA